MEETLGLWEQLRPFHGFLYSIALSLLTTYLIWLFRARVKIIC